MIRQFTFHKPKEILQPTLWLFLSQACSMLPAILAYMAIYTLGEAFVPPYTLDLFRLITLAALGVGCFVLQYIVELISYYFTYGKAYRDTADKRIAYIQKLRRQPLGFFSSKESGELISSFSNDFANVEYTLCYWLPYPLGVGALLAISIVWICVYDWRMGLAMFGMLPVCALLMLLVAKVKEKHSGRVMEAKAHAATQINEYLRGMKDLKAYHRTGEGFDTLKKAMGNLRDESLKDEAVAGSLSNLCASLVRFIVPVTVAVGMYLLLGGSLGILDFAGFLVLATKLVEAELMLVASISALRGMAPSGRRLDAVMTTPEPTGEAEIGHGDAYMFENVSFRYGEGLDVIRDVSFETPAGSLTALVGLPAVVNPRCSGSWPGFGIIRWGISAWRKGTSGKSGQTACLPRFPWSCRTPTCSMGRFEKTSASGMRQSARNGWWRRAGGPAVTSLSRPCRRATTPW